MTNVVSRVLAAASFLCGFLLLPSTSQAGSDPGLPELVVIDAGDAQVDAPVCETISTCVFAVSSGFDPAIAFDMSADALVHIEADIYDGLGCGVPLGTAAGDLPLSAGHNIVYLNYDPPLDPGTELSMVWRLGQCAATACSDYCIGNFPEVCQ